MPLTASAEVIGTPRVKLEPAHHTYVSPADRAFRRGRQCARVTSSGPSGLSSCSSYFGCRGASTRGHRGSASIRVRRARCTEERLQL